MEITIEAETRASQDACWRAATTPEAIMAWNAASDDWHCPSAEVDLRVGGKMISRMEAKDGSMGFDFAATFTKVSPHSLLEYTLEDGRMVRLKFEARGDGVHILQTFDAEAENPPEVQRAGWQAILNNFVRYVERA